VLVAMNAGVRYTLNFPSTEENNQDPDLPGNERSVNRWFNTSAFAPAPAFTIGTSSRNPVRGPGYRNLDVALMRRMPLSGDRARRSPSRSLQRNEHCSVPRPQLRRRLRGVRYDHGDSGPASRAARCQGRVLTVASTAVLTLS
jgi:hypothetical protein